MKLICKQEKLNVIIRSGGLYQRLLFNPMPDENAHRLVEEYGYRRQEVVATFIEETHYRIEVDDLEVLDWMDQRVTFYHLTLEELTRTVGQRYGNLVRVVGGRAFIASYKQLVLHNINVFIQPNTNNN